MLLLTSMFNVFAVAILVLTFVMFSVISQRFIQHLLNMAVGAHPDGANIVIGKGKTLFTSSNAMAIPYSLTCLAIP